MIFKKKKQRSSVTQEEKKDPAYSKEIEEARYERSLYDDHGSAIIGSRKSRPKF